MKPVPLVSFGYHAHFRIRVRNTVTQIVSYSQKKTLFCLSESFIKPYAYYYPDRPVAT